MVALTRTPVQPARQGRPGAYRQLLRCIMRSKAGRVPIRLGTLSQVKRYPLHKQAWRMLHRMALQVGTIMMTVQRTHRLRSAELSAESHGNCHLRCILLASSQSHAS